MKRTNINFNRVKEIAQRFILPFPYDPKPATTLRNCFFSCYAAFQFNPKPTDEELEQYIDVYFNL
jgi:hypothetical protein